MKNKRFPEKFLGCEECKSDPKIVLQENKSKITFLNNQRQEIRVIKVDGCAIQNKEDLRCDYALIPCPEVEIYVELKGSDIYHAVQQLESTICLLSHNPKSIKKLCFIVSTRVPQQTTTTQQLKSHFKKKYNASFQIKNLQDTYNLDNVTQ
jgi:hypothetical protein